MAIDMLRMKAAELANGAVLRMMIVRLYANDPQGLATLRSGSVRSAERGTAELDLPEEAAEAFREAMLDQIDMLLAPIHKADPKGHAG